MMKDEKIKAYESSIDSAEAEGEIKAAAAGGENNRKADKRAHRKEMNQAKRKTEKVERKSILKNLGTKEERKAQRAQWKAEREEKKAARQAKRIAQKEKKQAAKQPSNTTTTNEEEKDIAESSVTSRSGESSVDSANLEKACAKQDHDDGEDKKAIKKRTVLASHKERKKADREAKLAGRKAIMKSLDAKEERIAQRAKWKAERETNKAARGAKRAAGKKNTKKEAA